MPYFAPKPPPVNSLMTRTWLLRQLEDLRRLVAHAERELRRGVERQLLVAPIGDQAVRLHRRVRLHLRAVFARDDLVGLRETLLHVAARPPPRPPRAGPRRLPCCGSPGAAPPPPAVAACSVGPGKHHRRVVLHRCFERRDVRQALVFDAHQFRRSLRRAHALGRDRGDRLAEVAHHRITFVRFDGGIAQLRDRHDAVEHVHGPDAGICLGRRRVDGLDAGVRNSTADDARVQHAGQLDVEGVARLAGHLLHGVDAVDALADDAQLGVRRQLGRLVDRNVADHLLQGLADDARQHGAAVAAV